MTVKNLDRFIESLPDWAILDGCFGGAIKPTDIDGCVERGGLCLFLEHKLPGAPLKRAQEITFQALATQGNTVIVFWGQAKDGSDVAQMRLFHGNDAGSIKPATLDDVRRVARWWFWRADQLYRLHHSRPEAV